MPFVVGVPLRTPALFNVIPVGNVPLLNDQVSGEVPPDAASVCEYAVFIVPPVNVALVVMLNALLATMSVKLLLPVTLALSVACTVMVFVPATVGVPLKTPAVESVGPETEPDVIVHEYGDVPPLAAKVLV